MRIRILYLLLFLLVPVWLCAQRNCSFTHYSSENGLSQNTVMSILQDHKGNMWFATWDDINRFNGYGFRTYKARQGSFISLTNNRVDQMYEDRYGYLWLLTYDNRAHRFDPRTETFEQVPAAGEEGSSYTVSSIEVLPGGTVWILTENDGAIRVTTQPSGTYPLKKEIYSSKVGGIPVTKVYKVFEDREGNEWVLTNNGLGRMAPGEPEINAYFAEGQDAPHKSDQAFYSSLESEKEIFFGSDKGRVWRYRKEDGQFRLLQLPTRSHVVSVHCVSEELLVIATAHDGFFTYELKTGQPTHYSHEQYPQLPKNPIRSAYVDRTGEVWFEQNVAGVVVHFNPFTRTLRKEQIRVEPTSTDRSRPAFHIHEDRNGILWVHPYGGGFGYYDREQQRVVPFYNELDSEDWKFSNKIHSAFSDWQGNLWLCTHSKGLEKVTFHSSQFRMITPTSVRHESLSNEIRAICEDREQNLWVGLKDGMLRIYNKEHQEIGYLTEDGTVARQGVPLAGTVYFIMQDATGVIWIATKGDGLVRAEKTGDLRYSLTRYRHDPDDIYSLSNDNLYCVHEDNKGRIWIATFDGGINYISRQSDGSTTFINHRNHLKGYPIDLCYKTRYITSDNRGRIWVGTTAGAVTFPEDFTAPEDVEFLHFERIPSDPQSLSNNDVHWITATDTDIYLATFGGGLNKLLSIDEQGRGEFRSFSVQDGLASDVLLSIQKDDQGMLWITSENSISSFDPQTERFENYDDRSIMFRVRFSEAASEKTYQGNLLFGSSNGIFIFHPDSASKSDFVPPIVFSTLRVANELVLPGEDSRLKVALDDTRRLVLSHKENILAIQYAALDYTNPANIQYAYMLDGFEKQWTYADRQRIANYTNLPKGEYTFRVRSTNSDGVWVDNTRTIDIVVLPSFWETPLAYFLYVMGILLVILVAVYILFTIYRLKHEVTVEQQISDIKLRFFTNISHELRTPLTLISGPVEYVLKHTQLPSDAREQLQVVERNTSRMLRLVNQILDFRKIQNKKMKMRVQQVNVVPFVQRIMENFASLAEDHHIDFMFETEKETLYLWVDTDKLEKIVFNLLSNAFKYTPNGKMIKVFIHEDEETVSIGVQDQGIGIAENRRSSIFMRFENLVDKNLFNQSSTGIGLSLVKELVEMHRAVITVDSRLGEGSCFKVDFLQGKEHYDSTVEFIVSDSLDSSHFENVSDISNQWIIQEDTLEEQSPQEETFRKVMLLVEDNPELRFFLRSIFSDTYQIVEAVNGMEGWSKALKFLPDIIVSDVMMPEKDGIEMMKELRANMTTSHIPIVLLTAKSSIDSKLEGLEYGADDYITKPFSATYLKARVENLLRQRKKLQAAYGDVLMNQEADVDMESDVQESQGPDLSPNDRRFMERLVELMESNMDNGDLVVDDLVQEVAVSRSVFFKKLKTLTGLAPIKFIKEMRIKRAVQLIETGEFNMTQISYMVGINDPRYFSKCFKQKMGMTPTEYRDQFFNKK
ncbi:MAG: response regulator [Bacteroides sp.]|nr:response regulator [Bacteroides sp.]